MPTLELKNISKIFYQGSTDEVTALLDINLTFYAGEYTLIIGHNGSGKSTLLNVIDGTFKESCGDIIVDGIDIKEWSKYKRRTKIFTLYQDSNFGIVPIATIREYLSLAVLSEKNNPSLFRPLASKSRDKLILNALGEMNNKLVKYYNRKVYSLSPGERQALILTSLALWANKGYKILLADEPTGSLDPNLADKCKSMLESFANDGWTVIVVTHDQSMIGQHKGRIIEIAEGKVKNDSRE